MIVRRNIKFYKGEFLDIFRLIFKRKVLKGKYIRLFEKEFAKYIGVRYAISTSTARQGYIHSIKSLNIQKGSEILIPAYTIKGLIEITKKMGYVPVVVDINPDTFSIDVNDMNKKITKKTKVVMATHMFGAPCDIHKIKKICKSKGLILIEDCAHAHGSSLKGKKCGSFGKVNFFSFDSLKPISTFRGGMITTDDKKIYEKIIDIREKETVYPSEIEILKGVFMKYLEHIVMSGPLFYLFVPIFYLESLHILFNKMYVKMGSMKSYDIKMTNLQAMVGLKQLKILDRRNERRNKIANYLKKKIKLQNQKILPDALSSYYFLVFKVKGNLRKIQKKLLMKGIDISIKEEIADACNKITKDDAPSMDRVFEEIIQVPAYCSLKKKGLDKISKSINEVC